MNKSICLSMFSVSMNTMNSTLHDFVNYTPHFLPFFNKTKHINVHINIFRYNTIITITFLSKKKKLLRNNREFLEYRKN